MMLQRNKYIDRIKPYISNPIIKVIVGQRRVGKSYLLRQIMDYLKANDHSLNIIYINKELYDFAAIIDAGQLVRYVEEQSKAGDNVLMIDEVQEIQDYEKAIRHFFAKNYDIYISGSNSQMLSGELATLLSGRYIQFPVFPLDYSEFCYFHNLQPGRETLNLFLRYGGMPYLSNIHLEDELVFNYLQNIYQTILLKDVVSRYNIKHVEVLERLVYFLADNLGSIVSANKISDFLKSQHVKISGSVILNYLNYINDAYFINKTPRYDLQGKRLLETGEKYYFTDIGIRNALVGVKTRDINKILENIVYSHLRAMGYHVHVGKKYKLEIDFVASKNTELRFIQVAYILSDEEVINREFGNLQKIGTDYPKYVISMDDLTMDSHEGITHLRLHDFLQKSAI